MISVQCRDWSRSFANTSCSLSAGWFTSNEGIHLMYEAGARAVVGPLTRAGVAALAASTIVTMPTLALNSVEPGSPQPAHTAPLEKNSRRRP